MTLQHATSEPDVPTPAAQTSTASGAATLPATRAVIAICLCTLWLGMLIAISFLEAPLKFQAPGITVQLGLGIGQLVFAALNIAEALLLTALTCVLLVPFRHRPRTKIVGVYGLLAATYLVKVLAVRPPLMARTQEVLMGADPGQSAWHYIYIGCDVLLVLLLVICVTITAKQLLASINTAERA